MEKHHILVIYLGNGEHNVSGRYQWLRVSHQLIANHLRKYHADRLSQHHCFCFNATHTCTQQEDTVQLSRKILRCQRQTHEVNCLMSTLFRV